MSDCIFCRIVEGEISSQIIFETENFFSIFDVSPKTKDHALIISKKHFENLIELPSSLAKDFFDCIKGTYGQLNRKGLYEGFNIMVNTSRSAGQVVSHFHAHLFPRNKNDDLKLDLIKKED